MCPSVVSVPQTCFWTVYRALTLALLLGHMIGPFIFPNDNTYSCLGTYFGIFTVHYNPRFRKSNNVQVRGLQRMIVSLFYYCCLTSMLVNWSWQENWVELAVVMNQGVNSFIGDTHFNCSRPHQTVWF